MRLATLVLALAAAGAARAQSISQLLSRPFPFLRRGCDSDATADYKQASYDFDTKLYKLMGPASGYHFIVSQKSVWGALAALAEGAPSPAREKLFEVLSLPAEECHRRQYYNLSRGLETSGDDVALVRRRYVVFDESVGVNDTWARAVAGAGLVDVASAPLRDAPAFKEMIGQYLGSPERLDLNLTGNSIVIDSLDFRGLWTSAFPDASVERDAPFYDDFGNRIGTVDMLRAKRRVKMAYLPLLNAKVLELPVGNGGRYRFIMIQNIGKTPIEVTVQNYVSSVITDAFKYFRESLVVIDVAVPRMNWTHQADVRKVLEKMGVSDLWSNATLTAGVSRPAALPSSFVQRVSLQLGAAGVAAAPAPPGVLVASLSALAQQAADLGERLASATGLPNALGREFIGNRPFMFALVEPANQIVLLSGVFSKP